MDLLLTKLKLKHQHGYFHMFADAMGFPWLLLIIINEETCGFCSIFQLTFSFLSLQSSVRKVALRTGKVHTIDLYLTDI